MELVGRKYRANSSYRYGFNGKENDNEVKGEGGQQDYGMRIYDPRAGRFLSVDPLTGSYPWNSPYSYAENDVIRSIDLDGLEKYITHYYKKGKDGKLALAKPDKEEIFNNTSTPVIHKLEVNVGSAKFSNGKFNINQTFSLNSEVTLKGRNEAGNLKSVPSVRSLSDDDIGRVLAYSSVVFNLATDTRDYKDVAAWVLGTYKTTAARYESVAQNGNGGYGLLDFKYVAYDLLGIDRSSLLEINGTVYNPNEAGNYLWGMALNFAGTFGDPSEQAEAATWKGGKGRHDEPYDQKAITAGEQFGTNLKGVVPTDNTNAVKKSYGKYIQSGQAAKDYSTMKKINR